MLNCDNENFMKARGGGGVLKSFCFMSTYFTLD